MTASFLCVRVARHLDVLLAHWMLGLHWCVVICHVFSSPGIKTRSSAANLYFFHEKGSDAVEASVFNRVQFTVVGKRATECFAGCSSRCPRRFL